VTTEKTIFDERTIYTIADEHRERSTISLDKIIADVLQGAIPDVHVWVQTTYDRVVAKKPHLSRREKGDVVRILAGREAQKYPAYHKLMDELL
jgi:hypothetical protein